MSVLGGQEATKKKIIRKIEAFVVFRIWPAHAEIAFHLG